MYEQDILDQRVRISLGQNGLPDRAGRTEESSPARRLRRAQEGGGDPKQQTWGSGVEGKGGGTGDERRLAVTSPSRRGGRRKEWGG